MIRTVLVANRGEIARRVFRTCREMGIRTVAVYSDADVHAPFVTEADLAIHIGPPEPSLSYLDIPKIIDAARAADADAIHPGYGFLSENADFARACTEAGIAFIGPSPEAIETMGSKLASKRLMDESGVPTLPSIEIGPDTDLAAAADKIGFPVLVKASAGGGGKGMRIVEAGDDLTAAADGAIREAESAFGDGTVFLEKYLVGPRHIEVQVFGDTHGTVVSLGERECSIQRRHQKVIEESPSPVVDDDLRGRLGEAAVAAAKAVDYVGAGTVEFLVDQDGSFFFLEMNTRLQVEHPVTEAVMGIDLVRAQIDVADGAHIPSDWHNRSADGHAVEARLYAEDALNGFLPATGTVDVFQIGPGVRVDSGVESGTEVSIHYDPMLAKIIAHGPTRNDALRILSTALHRSRVHGVVTNRALLARILDHPDVIAGSADTAWLESRRIEQLAAPLVQGAGEDMAALAASLAGRAARRQAAQVMRTIPAGYRNNPSQLTLDEYTVGSRTLTIGYDVSASGEITFAVDGGTEQRATLLSASAESVRYRLHSQDHTFAITRRASRTYVDGDGGSVQLMRSVRLPIPQADQDPGSLLSPMPGKVVRLEVEVGAAVQAGDPLVVVEAMKMEHTISAPHDGTVSSIPVQAGDQVEADQVLAVVDAD